jgi:thiamine kinase-like enzyme
VYGAGSEKLIDRSVELSLLDHLATHAPGFAPSMYVAFTNGRLEEFIDGARTLEAHDMRDPSTSVFIARKMARLHSLPLPPSVTPQATVWGLIRDWLQGERESLALEQQSTSPEVHQQGTKTVEDALALLDELQPLLQGDATVLCHNDLLCGNILQDLSSDKLYLIDYECAPPSRTSLMQLTAAGTGLPTLQPWT